MSVNIAANLGRAQVLRRLAAWLEENPGLPIKYLSVNEGGEVRLAPAEVAGPGASSYRCQEIHGLYQLAGVVGAEVSFTADPYGIGWELAARWQVGAVPVVASQQVYQAAVQVRPAGAGRKAS